VDHAKLLDPSFRIPSGFEAIRVRELIPASPEEEQQQRGVNHAQIQMKATEKLHGDDVYFTAGMRIFWPDLNRFGSLMDGFAFNTWASRTFRPFCLLYASMTAPRVSPSANVCS